ncbi:MAG: MFS transporter [Gammaproteobacteria bacterium]|nr:MAG: MFS transporter [Gammaproteobacteria bacterium]
MKHGSLRDALSLGVNRHVFYGWVMLAVGGLAVFASGPGQSHIFSVYITPISDDLGISRTSIASAYAAATLLAAFGLPTVGRLIDRVGVRRVALGVAILFGFANIAFGQVTGLLSLALAFGALRFLGQGSLSLSSNYLVSQWFNRRRGIALSLTALGFSLSMALHPPLAQWLIGQVGWRESWFWLGLFTWVLLVPMIAVLVQNKPEDIGLTPDGEPLAGQPPAHPGDAMNVGLSLHAALRLPSFWIIALGLASLSMLVTGMFFHQVSVFSLQGLDARTAVRAFSISAVVMVLTMPVFGYLLDRLPTRPMFASALLIMSAALVALALVRDVASMVVFSAMFGLANAAFQAHLSFMWPRYFGRRHLGSIQGAAQTIGVVGAAIGPLPLGLAFDFFASYTGTLYLLAALPVGCAFMLLFLRPPNLSIEPH